MNTFSDTRMMHETAASLAQPACDSVPLPVHPAVDSRDVARTLFRRLCSFPVMLGVLLVGGLFVNARHFDVDPDVWWHTKVGQSILQTHSWPTTDSYSFTVHGQPWLAYEWLGDVVLAAAERLGGIVGLELLLVLLSAAIILSLYSLASEQTQNSKAGFVATSALLVLATGSFSLRPQMWGYLFLIWTVIALERFRKGKKKTIWLLPPMMWLWVNTHGSWIIGILIVSCYWLAGYFDFQIGGLESKPWTDSERRTLAFILLLSLSILPITPYGTEIAASPFEYAFSLPLNVSSISEWRPMPFDVSGGKLFLAMLLTVIAAQVILRIRWRFEQLGLFLFATMLACLHVRFVLVFVPLFAPILAGIISEWISPYDPRKDKFILNAVVMAAVLVGMIHYFPSRAEIEARIASHFPVGAVEYLNHHPVSEPMYNMYGFGGYLVWTRGPEHRVFIDGRGDVYERGGLLADYLHIARLQPGTLSILDSYRIQSCLLARDEPLATLLEASPEWRRVYSDSVSAVFVHALN